MKNREEIKNCLTNDLRNLICELESGKLDKEIILGYFRDFLQDVDLDSMIIVEVLEQFGDLGKAEARAIKVEEGW